MTNDRGNFLKTAGLFGAGIAGAGALPGFRKIINNNGNGENNWPACK